ncbi:PhnD/SsuA/transferrin family substrate-binding protein [Shewanella sp. UCD-KL12]|uniref:sensor histidine kinase n=1 Tax=Shewanella sp. UCD-KL12 TaxID=1917163 RepID=UPI0009F88D26|nr:PhnD/SsuA/transferrin family substrate-binding protein [Shewanella sp. UCD-KL12]
MNIISPIFCVLLAVSFCFCFCFSSSSYSAEPVRIGALAFASPDAVSHRWQPTFDRVSEQTGLTFDLIPLTPTQLNEYVANKKLDFIIGNALTTVEFKKDFGVSQLLTLVPDHHERPERAVGSALITRANVKVDNFSDLKHLTVISSDPKAFGGFQIMAGEMANHELNPFNDLGKLTFVGFPQSKLLNLLIDGTADVAILPTCVLEAAVKDNEIAPGVLKVVLSTPHKDFECQSSSRLYPSYALSKLGHVDHKLATQIVAAMLTIKASDKAAAKGRYQYWSAPVNDSHVFHLLKQLNQWPFVTNWDRLVKDAVPWTFAIFLALLLGYLHHLRVKRLVVLRTRALSDEMEQHKNTQKTLFEQQKQFYKAQRVLLTGEMASGIAHELNQPLAGIRYLTQGCIYRITDEQLELKTALEKTIQQVDRAQSTIKRFRQFCHQSSQFERCDITSLIEDVLKLMQPDFNRLSISPSLHFAKIEIEADVSLLQQVLVNLIRNALDAMETVSAAKLSITVKELDKQAVITIQDNGIGLSDQALERLFFPFETTKEHGLGLGMVVCKRIIEEHGGVINASNKPIDQLGNLTKGLVISIHLPMKART